MRITLQITILIALIITASGCNEVRSRGAAGTTAGLDCQAENIQRVIDETQALLRAWILSTISGDGKPDTAALRATARDFKSDGLRCAFVAAVAALTPPPAQPLMPNETAPQSLGLEIDREALRAATREIAASEWGVKSIVVAPGGQL